MENYALVIWGKPSLESVMEARRVLEGIIVSVLVAVFTASL